ncbi:MAG: FG-GAP repeat protein [Xanthomonadales bacterium]|nr:FG-GAP repeat protein [Xanthomonadales bacterium]
MRLDSVSYAVSEHSEQNSFEKPVGISFENNRLNYQWNNNITEYWINSEENLEQWFEIKQRPRRMHAGYQQGPLQVQMILDTNLKASLQDNTLSLSSSDPSKTTNTITYNKLKVWDATGKIMLAQMQLQDNLLTLLVDDKTAIYPLTIDPTLAQQAYLKASNTEDGDFFGRSVSISGDTLVVGATGESSNATGVNGDQSNNAASQVQPMCSPAVVPTGANRLI